MKTVILKRWIFPFVALLAFASWVIPLHSFAANYVASRNSDVFHKSSCFYVDRIKESNKVYFDSVDDALASGKRGCSRCNPESGYTGNKSVEKTGSADTNTSYTVGYAIGKKAGYESGYSDAQSELEVEYESKIQKERKEASTYAYMISLFLGAPAIIFLCGHFAERNANEKVAKLENEITMLRQELTKEKNNSTLKSLGAKPSDTVGIPADITLEIACTPIKGKKTPSRPYGDYTVYITAVGKKYHCKYNCSNATKAVHFFNVPKGLQPCKNCVPTNMYPQALPAWYLQVTNNQPGNRS